MSQDKINEKVQIYFKKVVKGYLTEDIKVLLNDELDNKNEGGCTAPLAMTVFSAMNQLGYLTSKKDINRLSQKDKNGKITDHPITETCIKEFCNQWMYKVNKNYNKSTYQEIFHNLFRNGIAHQFLSVYPTAITRSSKQKELIVITKDEPIEITLQVKLLAEDFLLALKKLDKKLVKAYENDFEFVNHIYERLAKLKDNYLSKNKELYDKVKRSLKNNNKIVTTTETTRSPDINED